jgi:translation elongation factor EF-Ts
MWRRHQNAARKGLAIQVKRADKESKEGTIKANASEDGKTIGMPRQHRNDFVAKTDNSRTSEP